LVFVLAFTLYYILDKGIGAIFSQPVVLGTLFFTIIHLLLPHLQINEDYYRYQTEYALITIILSIVFVVVGQFLFMVFITRFDLDYFKLFNGLQVSNREIKRMLNVGFFVFLVGFYFSYQNLSIILSVGVTEYLRDRISFGQGKGMQLLFAHWTYVSAFIFIFCYFLAGNKKLKRRALILSILSFGMSMLYYFLNSNRNSIFIMLLLVGGAWFINNKSLNVRANRKQMKRIFLMFVLVGVAFVLFFNIGKERYALYASRHKEFKYPVVKSLNGAFGNHENILWMLENDYQKSYGQTYIAGYMNIIPRKLWPNKPLGAGPKLKNFIDPGSYVLGGERNSSLTTGFFTELQMNYGVVGIVVFPVFIAIAMGMLLRYLNRSKYLIVKMVSFFTMILFFSQFYFAEFLGFFSRYFITVIPFILIYFAVSVRLKLTKD
jgi:oligosaccharide repeat unit polymerase